MYLMDVCMFTDRTIFIMDMYFVWVITCAGLLQ